MDRSHRSTPVVHGLKILHVARRFEPFKGGTEQYVRDLATAQVRDGAAVTVLALDRDVSGRGDRTRLEARAVIDGIEVIRVPGWGRPQVAVSFRPDRIVGAVAAHDVVHLHDIRFAVATVAIAARLARRPWIVHTHGLVFHTARQVRLKRLAMRLGFGPLLWAGGARIVASSESDRSLLLRDAPYLGRRTVTFENATPLGSLLELPRTPVPGRIVVIGRLVESKGVDDLIAVLGRLRDVDWTLRLHGEPDPKEERRLATVARSAGIGDRIEFRGRFEDDELPGILGTAALAAFPSHGEGFGLALLQAASAGVPVAARPIPTHRVLLGPDLTRLLVDFDDPEAGAAQLRPLVGLDPGAAAQLSSRLRERALGYDIERLHRQILGLYAELGVRRH